MMYKVEISEPLLVPMLTKGFEVNGHYVVTEGLPKNKKLRLFRVENSRDIDGGNSPRLILWFTDKPNNKVKEQRIMVTKIERKEKKNEA